MTRKLGFWGRSSTHLPKLPKLAYIPRQMRIHWVFCKMNKRPELFLILGPKVAPIIGPMRPKFTTHIKVVATSMWNNTDVKPMIWENDQKPEFLFNWRSKMSPKLGPRGPYSTHRWKYLQWACESILMWSPFEKLTKVQNFDLLWCPKWPKNGAFEALIVHISESSPNEHIKQD